MKKVVWLSLFGLFATQALGQHRAGFGGFGRGGVRHGGVIAGGFSGGFPRGGFGPRGGVQAGFRSGRFGHVVVIGGFGFPAQRFANLGLPPIAPIPPLGINAPFAAFGNRFGFGRQFFSSSAVFPPAFPLVLGGEDYGYPPAPNIIIVEQPLPQMIVQEPAREIPRPEIREYKQPAPTQPGPAEEQPVFGIVLTDGSTHSAVAVSIQDDMLHYVDPEGQHRRVSLDAVDREATQRLNRARKLDLRLPPPSR